MIVESETTNVAIELMMIDGKGIETGTERGIVIGSVMSNANVAVAVGDPAHRADIITTLEARLAATMS